MSDYVDDGMGPVTPDTNYGVRNVLYSELPHTVDSEDIVTQHMDKYYPPFNKKIPIEMFPDLNVPASYIMPIKDVMRTMSPFVSSNRTIVSLSQRLTDLILGGYFSIVGEKGKNMNDLLTDSAKELLKMLVFNTELFGNSALARSPDGTFSIYNAGEFWYDDYNHVFYSVVPKTVGNADGYLYEERRLHDDDGFGTPYMSIRSTFKPEGYGWSWNGRKDVKIKTTYVAVDPTDDIQRQLGIVIVVSNPYNTDWQGVSTFASVLEDIKELELTYHEYTKTMFWVKPRAYMFSEAVYQDENGNQNIDTTRDIYIKVDGDMIDNPRDLVQISQYDFPAEAFNTKIQASLNKLLSKLGLDKSILAFSSDGVEKSATQDTSEQQIQNAVIENKRSLYRRQLVSALHIISGTEEYINIEFVPNNKLNFSSNAQAISTLASVNMISIEKAVDWLNPRYDIKQKEEEVERIKELRKEMQVTDNQSNLDGSLDENGTVTNNIN